ncbi:3'-5' exonuclease [Gynuella sunshinyii]|uniref:DNA polymerase III, epsilon subunit and related 3'-5' exonuclease n=1 Tax=Gynuella sunshinyii YC6258 TaxID=1445510 RepID=A0A0C5VS53_9GAMM|nr:3'-5' exonuclease [Gynuella sunshinyii]AJQ97492.1 DNA polymerase III, epsilon subunit and related 3'-5' exonuclease [Gynuella sunshinyii YC6258]
MTHRIDLTETRPIIPELIPKTMWGKNVRAIISKQNWDALRWSFGAIKFPPPFTTSAVTDLGLPRPNWNDEIKCQICGKKQDSLELHELWEYENELNVQKLIGFVSVCEDCHLSLHLGFANTVNKGEKAKNHLIKLNKWTDKEAEKNINSIYKKWLERSQHEYTLNIDYLKKWFPDTKIHFNWLEDEGRWVGNRLDAISWAQKSLKSEAVILDTETTGLLTKINVEVIELAVINMKGKVIYYSRFHPRYKIPKRVIEIHGIKNEDVIEAPKFSEKHEKLLKLLNSKTVITYNAKFDKGVIENTCKMFKILPPDCKWECAMHIYRVFTESGKLLPLPESKHNAVDDCKAVLNIIKKMAKG